MSANRTSVSLTLAQQATLDDLERSSFDLHCLRIGQDPGLYERDLLLRSKRGLEARLRSLFHTAPQGTRERGEAAVLERYRSLLACDSLWEYRRLWNDGHVRENADQIAALASSLPIDWSYVGRTAAKFRLSVPSATSPDALAGFVQAMPCLFVFGSTFNASVHAHEGLDGIPVVMIDELLPDASRRFLDLAMKQVLSLDGASNAEVAPPESWRALGSNPAFIAECTGVIELALGRGPVPQANPVMRMSTSHPSAALSCEIMFGGATAFARLHEYGHLLMGHLDRPAGPAQEHAADGFAFTVLTAAPGMDADALVWRELGGLGFLVLAALAEKVNGGESDGVHPPSLRRLDEVVRGRGRELEWPLDIATAMLGMCVPTLEQAYGIHLGADRA